MAANNVRRGDGVIFSISVPVKDHVEHLGDCLDGLARQTQDVRVALLDASGRAGTAERLGTRLRHHRVGPDSGQAAAIAEGWERVPGDALGWLNADDMLRPGALDRVAAAFAADPSIGVVFGHAVHVDADGRFLEYFPAIDPDPAALRQSCTVAQPACFVRAAAVRAAGGIATGLHYAMDWDLWLRLLESGARFHFVDEVLAAARIHPGTKTERLAPRRFTEIYAVARRHLPPGTAARATARALWANLLGRFPALAEHRRAARAHVPRATIKGIRPGDNAVRDDFELVLPGLGDRVLVTLDRPIALLDLATGVEAPREGTRFVARAFSSEDWPIFRLRAPEPARVLGAELVDGVAT